ncbi:hypothetical protein MR829_19395, partial [Paracoccus versutus]|uniref:hypothetical protein n=1 Tax=Paracoccus versutus TaxID=34007 RepID=UPI001FB80725
AERERVDDFYAARSSSMPPLPWPNFSPPFSRDALRYDPDRRQEWAEPARQPDPAEAMENIWKIMKRG